MYGWWPGLSEITESGLDDMPEENGQESPRDETSVRRPAGSSRFLAPWGCRQSLLVPPARRSPRTVSTRAGQQVPLPLRSPPPGPTDSLHGDAPAPSRITG